MINSTSGRTGWFTPERIEKIRKLLNDKGFELVSQNWLKIMQLEKEILNDYISMQDKEINNLKDHIKISDDNYAINIWKLKVIKADLEYDLKMKNKEETLDKVIDFAEEIRKETIDFLMTNPSLIPLIIK